MQKKSNVLMLLNGAVILTLAGLFTKILSASYRIPYHHIAGDVGFYIYQQVYPLYGIILQISTYGFPVIISKLVSEHVANNEKKQAIQVIQVSFVFLSMLSLMLFGIQYGFAENIATLMGDKELTLLIQIISFSFLFVPFVASIRGYYQGLNEMLPTAVSQVSEQTLRVATILLLSFLLVKNNYSPYIVGAGAIFGSVVGITFSLMVLIFFLFRSRVVTTWSFSKQTFTGAVPILKKVAIQGIIICISGMGLLLIQLIDSFTLYPSLLTSGIDAEKAKGMKGIYDRGVPLIQLGTVVGTAFSLSLVPIISSAIAQNDWAFVKSKVNVSIKLSLVVGVGASCGLAGLMEPINHMLYGNIEGSQVLKMLSMLVIFTTISATIAAVLQGIGRMKAPAYAICIGVVIKILLNLWLVPIMYTEGAAISSAISFLVITVMNSIFLYKVLGPKNKLIRHAVKIIAVGLLMLMVLRGYLWTMNGILDAHSVSRGLNVGIALSGVMFGGLFYLALIIKSSIFTKNELRDVPLGKWLIKYIL
ncbi:putative polysaccharide biosynthesis protein [Priestia flexa]|uniref:putative polysaccharide biosynthesis protein n=1 Tax=Priestia flexa TaxID=86664 RepID=UPI0010FC1D99|nr:polysaccharide biosynthesis protein [Priestia flexa]QCS54744.1 polysaccharide biosynthesis protein [Priestia flexa]